MKLIPGNSNLEYECLYIHIPFCLSKCGYCSFYSTTGSTKVQRQYYLRKLEEELAAAERYLQNLRTVFVGGGTPTLFYCQELEDLFSLLNRNCHLQHVAEFSIECNPESLTADKIKLMAASGVNRVSVGVQSFSTELRSILGRDGSTEQLIMILESLPAAGIDNVGIDLIYGIPTQNIIDWRKDLIAALNLGITHLSTYELTVDEGSRLANRDTIAGIDPESILKMWHESDRICRLYDLERYEVSNFSRPGFYCRHNQAVWHGASYLGCGPSACSFNGRDRWMNPADLNGWLRGVPAEKDEIPAEARAREILAFGLRTRAGWSIKKFKEKTGFDPWYLCGSRLITLAEENLLEIKDSLLKPSARGLLFADHIAEKLLRL